MRSVISSLNCVINVKMCAPVWGFLCICIRGVWRLHYLSLSDYERMVFPPTKAVLFLVGVSHCGAATANVSIHVPANAKMLMLRFTA